MSRKKGTIIEYRSYDLHPNFPVMALKGVAATDKRHRN